MLTTAPITVDGSSTGGVRVSVSELARLKGVSKQAISKRLDRLGAEGLIEVRRHGREKTVSLAEWDSVTSETTDPARLVARDTASQNRGEDLDRDIAARLAGEKPDAPPGYTEQLTRKAGYEADLKEIEIRKRQGLLLETEAVRDAMAACAEALVRDIDQLPAFAEDLATAVSRNGVAGAREALKTKARELRETLARSMTLLAEDDDQAAA